MRTTLAIDDDVLAVAKDLAARRRTNIGAIISELAREALRPRAPPTTTRNGILLLPDREDAPPVTMELVNRLRDEEF